MQSDVETVSCVGILTIFFLYHSIDIHSMTTLAQHKARAAFIRSIMALCWPVILLHVVPHDDTQRSILLVPLLWNLSLWLLDMYLLHYTSATDHTIPASIKLDPSNVTALGFALSGLVGNRPDSRYSYIFLCAIVCCMIVVLPSHNMHRDAIASQVFESVQKGTLMWCIGLIITGVLLMKTTTKEVQS